MSSDNRIVSVGKFTTVTNCLWLWQRVLEQRVTTLLDKLLIKPSLVNPPTMEEGGLLLVSSITGYVFVLPLTQCPLEDQV